MKRRNHIHRTAVQVLIVLVLACGCAFGITENGGLTAPHLMSDALQTFTDWTSLVSNPALLSEIDQKEVTAGGFWILQDAGYNFASIILPLRLDHTVALSVFSSNLADLTGVDSLQNRLSNFDVGELNFLASYAWRFIPALTAGVNVNFVVRKNAQFSTTSAIDNINRFGVGGDLGIVFNPLNHYRYGNLNLGLSVQNVLDPGLFLDEASNSGDTLKTAYPVNLVTALSYRQLRNRLIIDGQFILGDILAQKENFANPSAVYNTIKVSGQARFFLMRGLALKVGYKNNQQPFAGVLLLAKRLNVFRQIRFDYDFWYEPGQGRELSTMLTMAARFGKTREEIESLRLYKKLIIAPMNDFDEAMRLYLAGMYWEAAFAFGKVIALYPGFHKIDLAALYMGKSYEYLQMNSASRVIYDDALRKYTTSDLRARYIYQLENLDYKEGKYGDALKNYALISNLYANNPIKPDADYIAGQVYYAQKNFDQAKIVLDAIGQGDENYPYAQYTLGIIGLEEKKPDDAIQHLSNMVMIQPKTGSDRVLFEAACTKLGHLYFEQVKLREALAMYSKVSTDSRYADECLLAAAWCYIKANSVEQAIKYVDQLITTCPQSLLLPEAYLVKGYCYTLTLDYTSAKQMFQDCINLCKRPVMTREEFKRRTDEIKNVVGHFGGTEKEVIANALRRPNESLLAARPAMRSQFDEFQAKQKELLIMKSEEDHLRLFATSKEKIQRDAEYALATVIHLEQSKQKESVIKRHEQDVQEIDNDIEKLKKELENLEK